MSWTRSLPAIHLTLIILLCSVPLAAEEISFTASVDNQKIGLDDALSLTVTVSGASLTQSINPEMPDLPGFDIAGTAQSSNISFVNGQVSASRSIIYTLIPRKQGTFTIAPVTLTYGGKVYQTVPIEVEVVEGSTGGGRQRRQQQNPWSPFFNPFESSEGPARQYGPESVLLVAEIDKRQVYQGEQATLSFKILTQISIAAPEIEDFPPLTGFWVEELQVEKNQRGRQVTYNGRPYTEFVVKRNALFPTRPGRITIGPAMMAIQLDRGGGFFGAPDVVKRQSKPLTIEALALPEGGRPQGYAGTVGSYSVAAALDRDKLAVGDVASLKITVSGSGNLKTINSPPLPPLDDFKVYEPKYTENITTTGARMLGEKSWEYVISPKSKGPHEIGAISLSFFDPATRAYQVVKTRPLTLQVTGAEAAAAPFPGSDRSQIRALRSDISFIHGTNDGFVGPTGLRPHTPAFYLLLLVPPLINLGLLAYRRQQENRRGDIASYLCTRAFGEYKKALRKARGLANAGEAKEFYRRLNDALTRYVAHKLSLSPQGLTLQVVTSQLEDRHVDAELIRRLQLLWNEAEFGLFAAGKPGVNSMEKLWREAEQTVAAVDRAM